MCGVKTARSPRPCSVPLTSPEATRSLRTAGGGEIGGWGGGSGGTLMYTKTAHQCPTHHAPPFQCPTHAALPHDPPALTEKELLLKVSPLDDTCHSSRACGSIEEATDLRSVAGHVRLSVDHQLVRPLQMPIDAVPHPTLNHLCTNNGGRQQAPLAPFTGVPSTGEEQMWHSSPQQGSPWGG